MGLFGFNSQDLPLAPSKYRGVSVPETILRGTGDVAGMLGQFVATPFEFAYDKLAPNFVKQGMSDVGQYIANTETAQDLIQLTRENPRAAANLGAVANIAGIVPLLRAAPGALNKIVTSMDTHVRGGMLGDALDYKNLKRAEWDKRLSKKEKEALIKKAREGGGLSFYAPGASVPSGFFEALESIPSALRDSIVPRKIASVRETGLSSRRRGEISGGIESPSYERGSLLAGGYLAHQQNPRLSPEGGSILASQGPIYEGSTLIGKLNAVTNKETIKKNVFRKDIPKTIQERHLNDIYREHGIDRKTVGGKDVQVEIRDPRDSGLGMEAAGAAGQSNNVVKIFRSDRIDTYMNLKNKLTKTRGYKPTSKDFIEFAQISGVVDGKFLMDLNKKLPIKKKLGGTEVTFDLLNARLKESHGKKLTSMEENVLNFWKERGSPTHTLVDDVGVVVNTPNLKEIPNVKGAVHFRTSHHSQAKELGGVMDSLSIDLDDRNLYATLSDGHDMYGVDPIGGHGLVNIVPTQKINLDTRLHDGRLFGGFENRRKRVAQGVEDLEAATGMKKTPKETPSQYHKRVIRDYEPTVTQQDYVTSLKNLGTLGLLTTEINGNDNGR